jgi:hypothetical protein
MLAEANFSLPGTLTPDKWRFYREKCPGGPLMQLGALTVVTPDGAKSLHNVPFEPVMVKL